MKDSMDLRSLLVGSVLVLLIMCILGASPRLNSPDPVRRFAIAMSDVPNGDVYVLDTVTGQVWPRRGRGGRTDTFYAPKLRVQTPEEPNESRIP